MLPSGVNASALSHRFGRNAGTINLPLTVFQISSPALDSYAATLAAFPLTLTILRYGIGVHADPPPLTRRRTTLPGSPVKTVEPSAYRTNLSAGYRFHHYIAAVFVERYGAASVTAHGGATQCAPRPLKKRRGFGL